MEDGSSVGERAELEEDLQPFYDNADDEATLDRAVAAEDMFMADDEFDGIDEIDEFIEAYGQEDLRYSGEAQHGADDEAHADLLEGGEVLPHDLTAVAAAVGLAAGGDDGGEVLNAVDFPSVLPSTGDDVHCPVTPPASEPFEASGPAVVPLPAVPCPPAAPAADELPVPGNYSAPCAITGYSYYNGQRALRVQRGKPDNSVTICCPHMLNPDTLSHFLFARTC